MKKNIIKIGLVFGLFFILLSPNFTSGGLEQSHTTVQRRENTALLTDIPEKTTVFSLYLFETTGTKKQEVVLPSADATELYTVFEELKQEMTTNPLSQKTQQLQNEFLTLLEEKNVVQTKTSKESYLSLLNPPWAKKMQNSGNKGWYPQPFTNRGTCALCSLGSAGTGVLIPLFLLPRPRIAMMWLGTGLTSAANLITSKGYVAEGAQTGFAFGFMGIGITYAIPGSIVYGFIGYSLFASTTAEYVAHYPPNRAPVVSDVSPVDGEQNVPLSTSELQFRIQDPDGDLMSYSVTTEPDVGSASGNLKPFGVYKVPIAGLQDLTNYTWHVEVTDGKDTTEKTMMFTTEAIAPIISNPSPADGKRDIPITLTQLHFSLKDYQGDMMEYTVQTSPNIGSAHVTGVHDGTYSIPVSALANATMYRWFVNVTDGQHWTRKIFRFETPYPDAFNPFEYGWHYRKQITIDHTKVASDLTDFPVLINIADNDLSQKAQQTGEDILFMNNTGVAPRLNYEIESYDYTAGNLAAWVNISQLSSSRDTMFYLYYGNPNCLSQQHPQDTWDANYKGVWHMNDATSTTITDSTVGAHTGVKESVDHPIETSDGKIAQAQNFIQADAITSADSNDFSMTNGASDIPFTLELWMYPTAINNHHMLLTKNAEDGKEWIFQYYGYQDYQRFISIMLEDNSENTYLYDQYYYDFQPNIWYHFAVTYDGSGNLSGLTLYFNGAPVTWSKTTNNGYIKMRNTNTPLFMGKFDMSDPKYYYGIMDEVRISKGIARNEGWIKTCYQNQNYPLDFFNVEPEEPGP